jgi:hypothetical protein
LVNESLTTRDRSGPFDPGLSSALLEQRPNGRFGSARRASDITSSPSTCPSNASARGRFPSRGIVIPIRRKADFPLGGERARDSGLGPRTASKSKPSRIAPRPSGDRDETVSRGDTKKSSYDAPHGRRAHVSFDDCDARSLALCMMRTVWPPPEINQSVRSLGVLVSSGNRSTGFNLGTKDEYESLP